MTDLRIWSTLTPAEREAAIEQAKGIIAGGEKRWHVVARLCGIKGGIGLRTAIDENWRARKRELDRKRKQDNTRAGIDRARAESSRRGVLAAMLSTPTKAPITLPKLKFMEENINGL